MSHVERDIDFTHDSEESAIDFLLKKSEERIKSLYDGFTTLNARAYSLLGILFTMTAALIGADILIDNFKSNMIISVVFIAFCVLASVQLCRIIAPVDVYYPGISPSEYMGSEFTVFADQKLQTRFIKSRVLTNMSEEIGYMEALQVKRASMLKVVIYEFVLFLMIAFVYFIFQLAVQ